MISADTVIVNGKVVTVDKSFSFKEAIAVKDGWIIDVGENSDIKQYIGPETNVIDLKSKVILPGAHDAHAHGIVFGTRILNCDCSYPKVNSIPALYAELEQMVKKTPAGKWIRGNGINAENFIECQKDPNRTVTRKDIDKVTPNHPVVLVDWSGHGVLINSKALEICGINKNTPNPKAGVMRRDEDGEPTGVFVEADALAMVFKHIPLFTDDELRSCIMEFQKILNKEGYTSYTESTLGPAGNERESGPSGIRGIGIYKQLQKEGLLTNRVSIGLYPGDQGEQNYENVLYDLDTIKLPEITDPNWLNIPMIKLFSDGIHLAHTAWMMDDYEDQPGYHGRSCLAGTTDEEQEEELHRMILLAHQRGYQVGVHAIGDRAVKATIDGYIKAKQAYPGKDLRHYVIHADSFGTNEMALRAAKFGIPYSVQPGLSEFLFEPSIPCVGIARAKRMFGLKEIINAGVICAGGADALHGEYVHWRQALQSAMTRRSAISGEVYSPELAISIEDGIRLFTYNGAYQEKMEHVRGSIEIGKVADFQVLDQDIFAVDTEDIGKIQVEMTMVGGKIVYSKS